MEKLKESKMIRILKIIGGIFCIALGIVGLFLPGLQGILLIFAGIMLLFPVAGKKIISKIKKILKIKDRSKDDI